MRCVGLRLIFSDSTGRMKWSATWSLTLKHSWGAAARLPLRLGVAEAPELAITALLALGMGLVDSHLRGGLFIH